MIEILYNLSMNVPLGRGGDNTIFFSMIELPVGKRLESMIIYVESFSLLIFFMSYYIEGWAIGEGEVELPPRFSLVVDQTSNPKT